MRRSAAVRFCAGGQPEMVVPAVIDNQRAEIGFQIMSALFCQRRERRSRHEQLSCSIVNRDSDNATISRSGERVRCWRHSRQNGDTAIWCSSCSDERGERRGHTSLADEKERGCNLSKSQSMWLAPMPIADLHLVAVRMLEKDGGLASLTRRLKPPRYPDFPARSAKAQHSTTLSHISSNTRAQGGVH
jgi:hypothetical protein